MSYATNRNHHARGVRTAVSYTFAAAVLCICPRLAAEPQEPLTSWRSRMPADPALTGAQRVDLLLHNNLLSPGALFGVLGPALGAQLRDSPPEWDNTLAGFGRRAGTQFAIQSARGLFTSGSAALLRRDPRYQRCDCQGGWRRTGHALSGLLLSADGAGVRRFDPSPLLSAFGAGYAGASLYPDNYSRAVKGHQIGSRLAGQTMAQNLFLEFSPELRRFARRIFRR